jgi:putative membrane protein
MGGSLSPLWGIEMIFVWLVVLVGSRYRLYHGLAGGVG